LTDKCSKCEDRNNRDGYICENECPFNEDGTRKVSKEDEGDVEMEMLRIAEQEHQAALEDEYYRQQEENSRTPQ